MVILALVLTLSAMTATQMRMFLAVSPDRLMPVERRDVDREKDASAVFSMEPMSHMPSSHGNPLRSVTALGSIHAPNYTTIGQSRAIGCGALR